MTEYGPGDLLLLACITALSGFVQSAIGFGYGIVVLALASSIFAAKDVSVIASFSALALNLLVFLRLRTHVVWEHIRPALLAVVIGAPLGVAFLKYVSGDTFSLMLGIIILATVVQQNVGVLARYRWHPLTLGFPSGLLSGMLAGAFGTGGPPLVAYVVSQQYERLRMVATLQLLLLVGALVRVEELLRQQLLATNMILPAAISVAACLLGSFVGLRVLHRLPERLFRRLASLFLLLLGMKYMATWALAH